MEHRRRISRAWILTPIAVLFLFVFWMFQGVVSEGTSTDHAEKESYDNFFIDYYNNDEGITFAVLEKAAYQNLPISKRMVLDKARQFLDEKQVRADDFTMIVDQGVYSNMSLGIADSYAWRVMFIDKRAESKETEEAAEEPEVKPDDTGGDPAYVNDAGVEEKLSYWIVVDGETGNILSAYSNGK